MWGDILTAMTKKRVWIVFAVLAIAIEVAAIVLLVPVVVSPYGAPIGTVVPKLGLVIVGGLLAVAAAALRKQSKAPAQN